MSLRVAAWCDFCNAMDTADFEAAKAEPEGLDPREFRDKGWRRTQSGRYLCPRCVEQVINRELERGIKLLP